MTRATKYMGLAAVAAVVLVAIVIRANIPASTPTHLPGMEYLSNGREAVWTADGKILYYHKDEKLWRYDVTSGEKKAVKNDVGLSISPNQQHAVSFAMPEVGKGAYGPIYAQFIKVIDRRTGNESRTYRATGSLESIAWLTDGLIVFSDDGNGKAKTVVVNRKGDVVVSMPGTVLHISGVDSPCFVYADGVGTSGSGTYYFDLATKKSRQLPDDVDLAHNYLYLSPKQLVYDHYGIKSVDLRTMTVHDLNWSRQGSAIRLSPNLDKYWIAHWPRGEYSESKLYMGNTPANALSIMKQIESGE